ncbi:hypothetical protein ACHWQZ_G003587 [Mnemiopsis leidyi]
MVQKKWRDDGKCGSYNLLEDGTPAQCDPDGPSPCCDNTRGYGYCGYGKSYCSCFTCEDYKLLKDWEESGGTLKWRHDGLCGDGNYLPDNTIAECDPDGKKPCCFLDEKYSFFGECDGSSPVDCTCRNCVDYRLVKRVREARSGGDCALLRLDSGFLKNVCFHETLKRLNYKCIYTDVKYKPLYTVEFLMNFRGVSNICENDPYAYQACGFIRTPITNTEVFCGGYICDKLGTIPGKYIECTGDTCRTENRDCDTSLDNPDTSLCNDRCEEDSCEDESYCYGYKYGISCIRDTHLHYLPVEMICDGDVFCDDGSDEHDCSVTNSSVQTCLHARVEGLLVPILNYTRCSRFDVDNRSPTLPYCRDYSDQTNCSDTQRVGGYCSINGVLSSVSKYVVCYNQTIIKLCDDNLQDNCVATFTNCTLHKHKICDETKDCYDGSDETDDVCKTLTGETEFTCVRRFNPNKGYMSTPVSWIMDGTVDCMEGGDENSTLWKVCPGEFKKVILPGDICQDVYRCPGGDRPNVVFSNLCDGVESCGDGAENDVCRVARDFPVIGKTAPYNGSIRDVCSTVRVDRSVTCTVREFPKPWGTSDAFGVITRKQLVFPTLKVICSHLFGENYLFLSCMDLCLEENIICPLDNNNNNNSINNNNNNNNVLSYDSCPGQFPNRAYTIVNNSFLTFVDSDDSIYHQEIYQCNNSRCVEYNQVCDLVDDCGDMSDEINCKNHMICEDSLSLTKHQFISLSQKCDGIYDCFDHSDECNDSCGKEILETLALKVICWVLGILATILNLYTIFRGFSTLKRCETNTMMSSSAFMILIACGDLLIGVYLVFLSVYDSVIFGKEFCRNQAEWLTGTECLILGVISTVGSQISLFTMTILSIIRMKGLTQMSVHSPTNRTSFVVIISQVFALFMASLAIAVTPLVPVLEDYFVQGMYYNHTYSVFIGFPNKDKHVKVLRSYYSHNITDKAVNISTTMSWREISEKVDGMFSQDFGRLSRSPVHFYGNDGVCLFKYFVRTDDARRSRIETAAESTDFNGDPIVWAILVLNFSCFIIITCCYIVITIRTRMSSQRSGQQDNRDRQRSERAIQNMITVIIATDFLSWVPFIVICALHNLAYIDASTWYAPFAMTVLPLNSVINPLVYDRTIVSAMTGKFGKFKSILEHSVVTRRLFVTRVSNLDEIEMNTLDPTHVVEGVGNSSDERDNVFESNGYDESDRFSTIL